MPERESADHLVSVLGRVRAAGGVGSTRPLSAAKQHTLACLVARAARGITAADLTDGAGATLENSALRMAMVRLRDHLPPGALPDAVAGRYTLQLRADQVDLWHLRALADGSAPLHSLTPAQLADLLRPDEPFGGSRHGELLDDEANLVRPMQLQLVNRVAAERPQLLTGELVERVETHAREHPGNEQLVALAASCIARSGDRRRAIDLIATGRAAMRSAGLTLSRPVIELEAQLLAGPAEPMPILLPILLPPPPRSRQPLPAVVSEQQRLAYVGSRAPLRQLQTLEPHEPVVRVSTIVSPSGSGATRLCAEYLTDAHARGLGVVYAPASEAGDGAFGALVAALPSLGEPITAALAAGDTETRRATSWQIVRRALVTAATDLGLVVVFDDCQWADSYLLELIAHLVRSVPDHPLHLVLCGRPVTPEHPWAAVQQIARRAGAQPVVPATLTEDELTELVRAARPDASSRAVAGTARSLVDESEGRPGTALVLLAGYDDQLVRSDAVERLGPTHALAASIAALSLTTRTVGAAAAVIGRTATVEQIATAADLPANDVLMALDELVRRGLVVERSVVEFDSADVHTRDALANGVLNVHRLQLTARVAELVEHDPHRRARLMARAVPVVPAALAAHELRESARELSATGLHREAAEAFHAARVLHPDGFELDDIARYTRSLELSGATADAAAERVVGVEHAIDLRQHGAALNIATSGLPEAEPLEGAGTVIDLLGRLDVDGLDDHERWRHAAVLARQHALRGNVPLATAFAERATSLARTTDQQFGAAIAHRMALSAASPPEARIGRLGPFADTARHLGVDRWAEFAVMQAVDHYELGDLETVTRWMDELDQLGDRLPALRQWHLLLLRATLAADDLRLDDAHRLRLDARRLANATGLHEGDIAFVGAEFATAWLTGSALPDLTLDPTARPDPATSALAFAALSVASAAAGQHREATQLAEAVARMVVDAPVSGGAAALAMACEQLARSDDGELLDAARHLLAARGDSLLLVGAGVVCVGPVARYRAFLTSDPDERHQLRLAARDLAERTGSPLWHSIARHDLAHP